MVIINMHMPVNWVVLQILEPYWYSMIAAAENNVSASHALLCIVNTYHYDFAHQKVVDLWYSGWQDYNMF
jgi:hypothetical protein